jgi:hypothetical protein
LAPCRDGARACAGLQEIGAQDRRGVLLIFRLDAAQSSMPS